MRETIPIPVQSLPAYGLRGRTTVSTALHRFPDPYPGGSAQPLPACVCNEDPGSNISDDPDDYMRARLRLAVEARRFSLCSNPSCFGRLTAVDGVTWDEAASTG